MLPFALQRLGSALTVLIAVSIIAFALVHVTPGDPVDVIFAGEDVGQEQRETYRQQLGLDRPLPVQYMDFAASAARGDLGNSIRRGVPVSQLIGGALPASVELLISAVVVALLLGVPIGVLSALRQNSLIDRAGTSVALFGISMPSFWLGIMLILVFSVNMQILPPTGRIGLSVAVQQITGLALVDSILTGNWAGLHSAATHLVLPALTLGTAIAATMARLLRSQLLEVREQDYIEALRARGLRFRRILVHMLRNALPAAVTVLALRIGALLGGAIVVETVFAWPGLGRLVVDSIRARDYPTVQGAVLTMAVIFIVINIVADLVNAWLDPRIAYSRKREA